MKNKGIQLEGFEEVRAVLTDLGPRRARNLVRATVHGVASGIAKDAKARAPKDKGTLRRAIKAKRDRGDRDKPSSRVIVEKGKGAKFDAFYWWFVEFGTAGETGHPAQPFARPAVEAARSQIPVVFKQEFALRLEKMLVREARQRAKK